MSIPRSYEEFWPIYVRAHRKKLTRTIHLVGTTAAVGCLVAFALTRRKALLAAIPFAGYGPAWFSHFFIEGNKPATFGNPLWSLRGDFEMYARTVMGTMDAEVERHCAAPADDTVAPPVDAVSDPAPMTAPDPTLN